MEIDRPQGDRGVHHRRIGRQHSGGNHCSEHPAGPARQDLSHHHRIGAVIDIAEQFESDDAGNNDNRRHDQDADHGRCHNAFLRFFDIGRGQRLLRDVLVGRPVEYLDEKHAGKQSVERDRAVERADHRQPFLGHSGGYVPANRLQRQKHHHQRQCENTDTGIGIEHRHCAQPAQNCIGRAHYGENRRDGCDRCLYPEQGLHEQRTRIDHGREINQDVTQQEQRGNHGTNARPVIALFQQLGDGGAIVAIVNRHKYESEQQQANETRQFPPGEQQHLVAVHPHQLIGRKVGQRDGARDKEPAQPTTCEEDFTIRGTVAGRARGGDLAPCHQRENRHQQGEHPDLDPITHCAFSPPRTRDLTGFDQLTSRVCLCFQFFAGQFCLPRDPGVPQTWTWLNIRSFAAAARCWCFRQGRERGLRCYMQGRISPEIREIRSPCSRPVSMFPVVRRLRLQRLF